MSSLPRDLTPEILSVLPINDLLRFRCVCSSWRSLIDSPYFAKLHLSRSQKTKSNLFLLERLEGIKSIHFDSLEEASQIRQSPPIQSGNPVEIAGWCNGVVALCDFSGGDELLWNPSTRKLRKLPSSVRNPEIYRGILAYGFGYDSVMDDYKLVRITRFSNHLNDSVFFQPEVFSLKMDTWREIECPNFIDFKSSLYTRSGALVNNALHWTHFLWPVSRIIAFDLVKEKFYLVPSHPDFDPYLHSPRVGELGGCLSMTLNHIVCSSRAVDVWVMKRYGVKESWSRLFFLPLTPTERHPSPYVIPLAYSRDHTRILLNYSSQLSWYDPARKTLDFVNELDDRPCVFEPALCIGSLIALDWKSENNRW